MRHVARGKAIEHATGIDKRAAVERIGQLVQFLSGGCLILSHNPPPNDHAADCRGIIRKSTVCDNVISYAMTVRK